MTKKEVLDYIFEVEDMAALFNLQYERDTVMHILTNIAGMVASINEK